MATCAAIVVLARPSRAVDNAWAVNPSWCAGLVAAFYVPDLSPRHLIIAEKARKLRADLILAQPDGRGNGLGERGPRSQANCFSAVGRRSTRWWSYNSFARCGRRSLMGV